MASNTAILRRSVLGLSVLTLALPGVISSASAGSVGARSTGVSVTQHLPIPVDTDGVSVTVEGPGIPEGTAMILRGGRERVLHLAMDARTATSLVLTQGTEGAVCKKVNQALIVTLAGAAAQAHAWYTQRAYDTATGEVGQEETTDLLMQSQSTGDSASTYTITVCA